jgi:hypothetical protein
MTTFFVRHQVEDYAQWRKTYDDFAEMRGTLGVTAASTYQALDDPNDVTVIHEFATPEAAKAFGASPELRDAMHNAGVVGAPTVWITDRD